MWYCQPDGGQWNVRVTVLHTVEIEGKAWLVIQGKDLVSMFDILIVPSETVFTIAQ